VETAKLLLKHISIDEMPDFLTHALSQAAATNFDVQTLGGLKQYVTGYLAARKSRAAASGREAARRGKEREEALRSAYDHFRITEATRVFLALPKSKQVIIEAEAQRYAAQFKGSLRGLMLELRKRTLTAERYNERIKTFEEWSTMSAS
jgi:hypothetical protein